MGRQGCAPRYLSVGQVWRAYPWLQPRWTNPLSKRSWVLSMSGLRGRYLAIMSLTRAEVDEPELLVELSEVYSSSTPLRFVAKLDRVRRN